jgi:hypothetical protein
VSDPRNVEKQVAVDWTYIAKPSDGDVSIVEVSLAEANETEHRRTHESGRPAHSSSPATTSFAEQLTRLVEAVSERASQDR